MNDFNWNVAPSNHESKEFAQLHALAEKTIAAKSLLFNFESDEAELKKFIKQNFKTGRKDVSRIQIDKNNFTHIYRKWREAVLPHIDAPWDMLKKKYSLYDRDFYLAELNVDDNGTADIADDKVATDFYITVQRERAEQVPHPAQERGRAVHRADVRFQVAGGACRLCRVLGTLQASAAEGLLELHREASRPARAAGRA